MKDLIGTVTITLLLVFSAVCPLAAGLLFLLAAGVGLVNIDL